MAKDPTFPFYAQDFIVTTLRWSRAMKGLQIDLMAESWINGGLIDEDGHPAGLMDEDIILWNKIKHRWEMKNNVWIDTELEELRTRRENFRKKQTEIGKKGGRPKKITVTNESQPLNDLENTKPNPYYKNNGNKTLLENGTESESENLIENVSNHSRLAKVLIPTMLDSWKKLNPTYPEDREKDYHALQHLAKFITQRLGIQYDPDDEQTIEKILSTWEKMAGFVVGHDFFRNYSIAQIDTHSQNILQSLNNASGKTNSQNKQSRGTFISAGPRNYGEL